MYPRYRLAKGAQCCEEASSTSQCAALGIIPPLSTHKEQLSQSPSHGFSQAQGSGAAFPNKSLRNVVLPLESGDSNRWPHTWYLAYRRCSKHKSGISPAGKVRPMWFQPAFPTSTLEPLSESTAGQRDPCFPGIQPSQAHHYPRKHSLPTTVGQSPHIQALTWITV